MIMRSAYGLLADEHTLESPCRQICEIDDATNLCKGCRRSLAEIAAWTGMTASERRRIMDALPGRQGGGLGKVGSQ